MDAHQNGAECCPQSVDNARRPTPQSRPRFPKIARGIALVVAVGLIAILTCEHAAQVSRLRQASANIKPGDTRADVLARLGQPPVEYSSGFPPQGGPASVFGVSYGGPFNYLRATVDHWVYSACDGFPEWYARYLAQDATNWPIVIEFDTTGTVTTVRQ
jgi:hypothetical protein